MRPPSGGPAAQDSPPPAHPGRRPTWLMQTTRPRKPQLGPQRLQTPGPAGRVCAGKLAAERGCHRVDDQQAGHTPRQQHRHFPTHAVQQGVLEAEGWPSPPAPGDPLLSLIASRPRRGSQALSFSGPLPGPTCPHQSRWYCPAPPVKGGGRHQAGIWVCPAHRVISMGCDLWASPTPPQGPCALSSSGLAGAPSGLSLGATSPCPPGLSASVPMGPAQCFLALG